VLDESEIWLINQRADILSLAGNQIIHANNPESFGQ